MDASKIEIAKTLAEAHLGSIFDKYLVVGFNIDTGDDVITNCNNEQLGLLLALFAERIQRAQTITSAQQPDEPPTN